MAVTLQTMLTEAQVIRRETEEGKNTSERVGKLFFEIIEYLQANKSTWESGGGTVTSGNGSIPDLSQLYGIFLKKNSADEAQGHITFHNGITVENGLDVNNITASGNITVGGTIQASKAIISGEAEIGEVQFLGDGDILTDGDITTTGTITATNGIFDNITVNKAAYFFELVISQLRAQKGALLITNAQCIVDHVEEYTVPSVMYTTQNNVGQYKVFFKAEDKDTGKQINQSFVQGDLAICQTFDNVRVGTNNNVSSKYYWRLVTYASSEPSYYTDNNGIWERSTEETPEGKYHYIVLSNGSGQCDPSADNPPDSAKPAKGDEIIQLGFQIPSSADSTSNQLYTSSATPAEIEKKIKGRQGAIILSAYPLSKDPDLVPPFLAFYNGINSFNLSNARKTYIDAQGAHFVGSISGTGGSTTGGGDGDDNVNINMDIYTIIPSTYVITKDSQDNINPQSITIQVLLTRSDGSESILMGYGQSTPLTTGYTLCINDTPLSSYTIDTTQNFTFSDFQIKLKDSSSNVVAVCPITAVAVDATNGNNGAEWESVYKSTLITDGIPQTPDNVQVDSSTPALGYKPWSEYTTAQKNGWSTEVPTDETNKYVWECSRRVTYTNVNSPIYDVWMSPFRRTGQPGQQGERGADGFGLKNIFALLTPEQKAALDTKNYTPFNGSSYPNTLSGGDTYKEDDITSLNLSEQFPSNKIRWYDDPVSYTSTEDVYCSQSSTIGRDLNDAVIWTNWSHPAMWAARPSNAIPSDTVVEKLVAFEETFCVTINTTGEAGFEDVQGGILCRLKYAVALINGSNVSYADSSDFNNYTLQIAFNGDNRVTDSNNTVIYATNTSYDANNAVTSEQLNTGIYVKKFECVNLLSVLVDTAYGLDGNDKQDYYCLARKGYSGYLPNKITVTLIKNSTTIDTRQVNLIFDADNYWSITKAALNTVYQGLSGDTTRDYSTGFSHIRQTWKDINFTVGDIEGYAQGAVLATTDSVRYLFIKVSEEDTDSITIPDGNAAWSSFYDNPPVSGENNVWVKSNSLSASKYTDTGGNTKACNVYVIRRGLLVEDASANQNSWDNWEASWSTPRLYRFWNKANNSSELAKLVNSSNLSITADSIKASVNQTVGEAVENKLAEMEITADRFSNYVGKVNTLEQNYSTINQTVGNIDLAVTSINKSLSNYNYLKGSDFISQTDLLKWWDRSYSNDFSSVVSSTVHYDGYQTLSLSISEHEPIGNEINNGFSVFISQEIKDTSLNGLKATDSLCLSCYVRLNNLYCSNANTDTNNGPKKAYFGFSIIPNNQETLACIVSKMVIEKDGTVQEAIETAVNNEQSTRKFTQVATLKNDRSVNWKDTDWYRVYTKLTPTANNSLANGLTIRIFAYCPQDEYATDDTKVPIFYVANPKLEIGDTPTSYRNSSTSIGDAVRRTGIDITQGKITLDAENTEITGALDLLGTFTSTDSTMNNTIIVNANAGSIKMMGPVHVNDVTGTPYTTETRTLAELKFNTDYDNLCRGAELDLYGPNGHLYIDGGGIMWENSSSTITKSKSWSDLLS